MRDVAERAGVSITTVSHVINQTRVVSDDTRARVLNAMNELGYQPNVVARSLRRKETLTIGVIVPDSAYPFYAEVIRGIEDTCFEQGYTITLCNSDSNLDKELRYTNMLIERQVDGILFFATSSQSVAHIRRFEARRVPLVVVDRPVPELDVDSALIENRQGGWLATQHLIDLGHMRISCIGGPPDLLVSTQRAAGYRQALTENGLSVDESLIVNGDFEYESGYRAANLLLARETPPTAIFAFNDLMAAGAVNAILALQRQVPGDVSVVGFDDIRLAALINPPLTTVAQPKYEIGAIATTMLLERIGSPDMPPRQQILDAELLVRRSSGPVQ
jgi:LacI family transcriptional regulator